MCCTVREAGVLALGSLVACSGPEVPSSSRPADGTSLVSETDPTSPGDDVDGDVFLPPQTGVKMELGTFTYARDTVVRDVDTPSDVDCLGSSALDPVDLMTFVFADRVPGTSSTSDWPGVFGFDDANGDHWNWRGRAIIDRWDDDGVVILLEGEACDNALQVCQPVDGVVGVGGGRDQGAFDEGRGPGDWTDERSGQVLCDPL